MNYLFSKKHIKIITLGIIATLLLFCKGAAFGTLFHTSMMDHGTTHATVADSSQTGHTNHSSTNAQNETVPECCASASSALFSPHTLEMGMTNASNVLALFVAVLAVVFVAISITQAYFSLQGYISHIRKFLGSSRLFCAYVTFFRSGLLHSKSW